MSCWPQDRSGSACCNKCRCDNQQHGLCSCCFENYRNECMCTGGSDQETCRCQECQQPLLYQEVPSYRGNVVQEYPQQGFIQGYQTQPYSGDAVCAPMCQPVFEHAQDCNQSTYRPVSCSCQGAYGNNIPCPVGCETEYQTQYCSGACDLSPLEYKQCPCCGNRVVTGVSSQNQAQYVCPGGCEFKPTPGGLSAGDYQVPPPVPVCPGAYQGTIGVLNAQALPTCGICSPANVPSLPQCPGGCVPFNAGDASMSFATSPMEGVTVYSASYKPMTPAGCRPLPVRPVDNLCTPGAIPVPRGCAPTFCLSPKPAPACTPRDNYGVITPVGPCPMSSVTINRASYQPMPLPARCPYPWIPIQGYQYPWPPLDATTVYHASYMPPGCVTPPGYVPIRPVTCPEPPCYAG